MTYIENAKRFGREFWDFADQAGSIMITAHTMPDDDAVSSALSMDLVLRKKYPGKKIAILFAKPVKDRWAYFFQGKEIGIVDDIYDHMPSFDLGVFVDGNYFDRFSGRPEDIESSAARKICIDHHSSKADRFDLALIETGASSTAELIYHAFVGHGAQAGKELAESLLLGIIGDTGRFNFVSAANAHVLEVAAELVRQGDVDIQRFMAEYSGYSERVYSIIKEFVKNAKIKRIKKWPAMTYSLVKRSFIEKNGFSETEVESAASLYIQMFATSVNSASWGAALYPLPGGKVKIGLRSRPGGVNARLIMETMGIGSGHDRSSGGVMKSPDNASLDAPECWKEFAFWLKANKPVL